MNKKLLKKVLVSILAAAMLFNFSPISAYAKDSIKVKEVYTNVQKLTMATGTTRKITTYTEPEDASDQSVRFKSSDKSVATVSTQGIVTAVAPGKAVITVTARDGSLASEKVKVTVLENLLIDKTMLDSDNEIVIMDKTYGNITIDNSVGSVDIFLSGVKVKNKLLLENGTYNVNLYKSNVKYIENTDNLHEIVSLSTISKFKDAIDKLNCLGLYFHESSSERMKFTDFLKLTINQDQASEIRELNLHHSFTSESELFMKGFMGRLGIDIGGEGTINLDLADCNIPNTLITGNTGSGFINFNSKLNSTISNLFIRGRGSATVNLGVPVANLNIESGSQGVKLIIGAPVETLNNAGTGSSISILSRVAKLVSSGKDGAIQLFKDGIVDEKELGKDSNLVDSTLIPAVLPNSPRTIPILAGTVYVNEDFEDGVIDPYIYRRGSAYNVISDKGNNSTKSMMVGGRAQTYEGATISLSPFSVDEASKHVKLSLSADVMFDEGPESATFNATIESSGKYTGVASVNLKKGEWGKLSGSFMANGKSPLLYFEADNKNNYYMDNVRITIETVEDLVPVSSVAIDKAAATIGIGGKLQLTAAVLPSNAEDTTVTWKTDNIAVAGVDVNGLVTAYKEGTAIIYAISNYNRMEAKSVITVDPSIKEYSVEIDKKAAVITSIGGTAQFTASIKMNNSPYTGTVTWSSSDDKIATIDTAGKVTAVAAGTATITAQTVINVDGVDKTFSSTSKVIVETNAIYANTCDDTSAPIGLVKKDNDNIVLSYENGYIKVSGRGNNWEGASYNVGSYLGKELKITADVAHGKSIPTNVIVTYSYDNKYYSQVANSGDLKASEWKTITGTFTVDNDKAIIYFESADPKTDLYIDNIIISEVVKAPVKPSSDTVTFDEIEVGKPLKTIGWNTDAISATVITDPNNAANRLLEVKPKNYNGAAVINLTIPEGKTLGDYAQISYKALWLSGDVGWKTVKVEAGSTLSGQFYNTAERVIGSYYREAGTTASLATEKIDLNGSLSSLTGEIEVAIGISCNGNGDGKDTVYYLDDIQLVPKPAQPVVVDFNNEAEGKLYTMIGWGNNGTAVITTVSGGSITVSGSVISVTGSSANALEVKPANYNSAAVIKVTLPAGKTLGDYSKITFKALWLCGDIAYKMIYVEAGTTLTGAFNNSSAERTIGEYDRKAGATMDFESITIDLNGKQSNLSGSIQIAIGINCAGSSSGMPTVYYLDDITLVPKQ